MQWNEFAQRLKTKTDSVYVFMGPAGAIKEKGFELISGKFSPGNITRCDEQKNASEILEELNSTSLFASEKLVLVRGANRFSPDDIKALISYKQSPETSLVLFFEWDKKLNQMFQERQISPVACFNPENEALLRGIKSKVSRAGKNIGPEAVEALIDISGADIGEISTNIEKALNFAGDEAELTKENIEKVSTSSEVQDIFDFSWGILKADPVKTLNKFSRIDKNNLFGALGYIRKMFENLLVLKEYQTKNDFSEGASKIKLHKNNVREAREFVNKTPVLKIKKCLLLILETYEKIKSGETHAFENALTAVSAVLRLAEGRPLGLKDGHS